ncbi:hypothetical protein DNTS_026290 [Danionella cerebrum]|uniref:Uncharacterized protein n=1 Tax=Danionella cerebrum TaxID=2873325 RepID=A0A553QY26_9TELE|nr:hypothetical protein DNTS_026290 [Danionella translucida]
MHRYVQTFAESSSGVSIWDDELSWEKTVAANVPAIADQNRTAPSMQWGPPGSALDRSHHYSKDV